MGQFILHTSETDIYKGIISYTPLLSSSILLWQVFFTFLLKRQRFVIRFMQVGVCYRTYGLQQLAYYYKVQVYICADSSQS